MPELIAQAVVDVAVEEAALPALLPPQKIVLGVIARNIFTKSEDQWSHFNVAGPLAHAHVYPSLFTVRLDRLTSARMRQ